MARLCAFAGWAGLAVAVAIAALTLPLADANATSDDEQASSSLEFNEKDGTLSIEWSGPTVPGMADYLHTALNKYGAASHRVVLFLNSAGGQVDEGDRVIHLLDGVKPTHRLITVVLDGDPYKFRTTPLFNVEKTAPYGHSGSVATIEDAIAAHFDPL